MATKFYNSLTKNKTEFKPLETGKVKLYTCGPTVYETAHIGNFRAFMFEDLLKRYLLLKGFEVIHVMNITDVDDKTIKRSREKNVELAELTKPYMDHFFKDIKTLKIIPADFYPRATEHIQLMIDMIQKLIDYKHAYITADGSVYFAIQTYNDYGKLISLNLSHQQSTERVMTDEYDKENPQDFALWKGWKEEDGNVCWDAPWGRGRPGWHIECSAMSTKYLGNTFDIHCGGVDNIFPHHENEIAQAVCATGEPFVNIWMHCEYLLEDHQKMSKSFGNFYRISDLLDYGLTPESIRYLLLSTHYRTKLNFSLSKKHEALQVIIRIADTLSRLESLGGGDRLSTGLPVEYDQFIEALDNDLDTPRALAVFFDWLRQVNTKMDNNSIAIEEAQSGINFINRFHSVFDLITEKVNIPAEIAKLVEQREEARTQKDWNRADDLREMVKVKGWIIEDTPNGPRCKPIKQ